jgi:hypothetical protein
MDPVFAEDCKYRWYQVLIDDRWITINPWSPFPLEQVRGMRGYRLWDYDGLIVKEFVR